MIKQSKDIGDRNRTTTSICEYIRATLYKGVDKITKVKVDTLAITRLYIRK